MSPSSFSKTPGRHSFLIKMLVFVALGGFAWAGLMAALIVRTGRESLESPPSPATAIVVLGAGVEGEKPSPIFAARLRHGVELYQQGLAPRLILTGGFGTDKQMAEAEVGRSYALEAGVPDSAILIETASRTTLQNLKETARLLAENNLEGQLILVSDPWHLRRASLMAKGVGLEVQLSGTPFSRFRSWQTGLPFLLRETYFTHHYWVFRQ